MMSICKRPERRHYNHKFSVFARKQITVYYNTSKT